MKEVMFCKKNFERAVIWLQIVMVSPETYLVKNYESLSIFSEYQLIVLI